VASGPLQPLIDELGRLPGIGPKSAQRLAFYLLRVPAEDANRLADAIIAMKQSITLCGRCFNVAQGGECEVCQDSRRDPSLLCVVEDPRDIMSVEKTQQFRGRYHVLHGALNPIEGVGPDQLKVRELLSRLDPDGAGHDGTGPEGIKEVILCTNPNLEGEATAMYLARLIRPLEIKVTRIASGLPVGGDLEYADELTLGRALEGRHEVGD
jgi:recombination protein RecR